MGIVKSFKEFINERVNIPEIFDENKENLLKFFDFLIEANKRPDAKYHLAVNTDNSPAWSGEIEEKYRYIWENFVNQLKQFDSIPLRVLEEVVDKDGNCIDPNWRNILVDLDENYTAEFDEDDLTFKVYAESFLEDADFIQENLLEVTAEGYEPKHQYEGEDDSYLYDDEEELKEIYPEFYKEWRNEEGADEISFGEWLNIKHPEINEGVK